MKARIKTARKAIAATVTLTVALAAAPLVAQDANAGTAASNPAGDTASAVDDFEAALFAGTGDGTGTATDAVNAVTATGGASSGDATSVFDAEAASGEKAKTEYLVGGTVAIEAKTLVADEACTLSSGAFGKLFAKVSVPDYGALYVAYNAQHAFLLGYSGDGMAPPAADQNEPDFSLSELHYSFDVAKLVFVRVGNQLISWGPSRVWSPVDFINLRKEDSFAAIDSRTGKSGLRLHAPLPFGNAFAFADFSGMTKTVDVSPPPPAPAVPPLTLAGDPLETVNLGGRIDFTAGGFEFGLTGYGGKHAVPRLGADFSGRLLGSTVYGEFAAKGTDAFADPSFMASFGLSRALGDLRNWTVSAEGFWNSKPGTEPLYQGEYYAYASVAADKLFSPHLKTTASALANLDDGSYTLKLAESFAFPREVPFTLAVSYAGGGEDGEFTKYSGDKAVSVTASTTINF
jgi:hypothetical protein